MQRERRGRGFIQPTTESLAQSPQIDCSLHELCLSALSSLISQYSQTRHTATRTRGTHVCARTSHRHARSSRGPNAPRPIKMVYYGLTTAIPARCCSAAGQISGSGGGRTREPGHVCDHATAELIAVTGASPPSPPGPSAARLTWAVTSWPRETWAEAVEARAPEEVEARAPLRTLAPRASRTRSRGPACNRLLPTRSPWPPCAPRQAERSRRRVQRTPPRRGPPTCSRGPGPPRARPASPCSGAGSLHYQ